MTEPEEQDQLLIKCAKEVKYALVDPQGKPRWAVGTVTRAIGMYGSFTNDIILNRESRMRIYDQLTRNGWTIRKCRCTVHVSRGSIARKTVENEP